MDLGFDPNSIDNKARTLLFACDSSGAPWVRHERLLWCLVSWRSLRIPKNSARVESVRLFVFELITSMPSKLEDQLSNSRPALLDPCHPHSQSGDVFQAPLFNAPELCILTRRLLSGVDTPDAWCG